ncbi:MAG: Uma2 family endonuclease [Pirellulales bacterium]
MATTQKLLTAEEFLLLPDTDGPLELVCGVPTPMNMPGGIHGLICARLGRYLGAFVEDQGLGVVLSNDSGIVTRRGPDSVRGADLAYYSFKRLPRGTVPRGYPSVAPELVFEVRSPSDSWPELTGKAGEYLQAGVLVVCVIDPEAQTATVYRSDRPAETLAAEATLGFPELLPGWDLPLGKLFE